MKPDPTVPCSTCGETTTYTGTKKCNWCWELERLLGGYLARGGDKARDFVIDELWKTRIPPLRPRAHADLLASLIRDKVGT